MSVCMTTGWATPKGENDILLKHCPYCKRFLKGITIDSLMGFSDSLSEEMVIDSIMSF